MVVYKLLDFVIVFLNFFYDCCIYCIVLCKCEGILCSVCVLFFESNVSKFLEKFKGFIRNVIVKD